MVSQVYSSCSKKYCSELQIYISVFCWVEMEGALLLICVSFVSNLLTYPTYWSIPGLNSFKISLSNYASVNIQRDNCDSVSGKGFRWQCKSGQSWCCVRYGGNPQDPVVIFQSPTLCALHHCLVLCAHTAHDQHFSRSSQPLCGVNTNLLLNAL